MDTVLDLEESVEPNVARRLAAETFWRTLEHCRGKDGVSERYFASIWVERMRETQQLTEGWHNPPPSGVAVLSGRDRISFSSLDDKKSWPGETTIDWMRGYLYAYCSPISIKTGVQGDFAVTLYFGADERVLSHFENTHRATREVLRTALTTTSSVSLFEKSHEIFTRYNLKHRAISAKGDTPANLGHTFVLVDGLGGTNRYKISRRTMDNVRRSRRSISLEQDWDLRRYGEYTVSPRLVSATDATLPQISYHYVIDPAFRFVLDEPDLVLQRFRLLPFDEPSVPRFDSEASRFPLTLTFHDLGDVSGAE